MLYLLVLNPITAWLILLALLELFDLVESGCCPLGQFPSLHPAWVHGLASKYADNQLLFVKLDRCAKTGTCIDCNSRFNSCHTLLLQHAVGVLPSVRSLVAVCSFVLQYLVMSGAHNFSEELILHADGTQFGLIKCCWHVFEVYKSVWAVIKSPTKAKSACIPIHFFKEGQCFWIVFELWIFGYIGISAWAEKIYCSNLVAIALGTHALPILDIHWDCVHFFCAWSYLLYCLLVWLLHFLFLNLRWTFSRHRTLSLEFLLWLLILFTSLAHLLLFQALHGRAHDATIVKLFFTFILTKYYLKMLFFSFVAYFFWLVVNLYITLFVVANFILCK